MTTNEEKKLSIKLFGFIIIVKKDERSENTGHTTRTKPKAEERETLKINIDMGKMTKDSEKIELSDSFTKALEARKAFMASRQDNKILASA